MNANKILLASVLAVAWMPVHAAQTEILNCASKAQAYVHCKLPHAHQRDIRIERVVSGNCEADDAWGVDKNGIWVDNGCAAVFEYSQANTGSVSNNGGVELLVAPGFVEPYYGPGYYYGAGYYENNGWNHDDYDHRHHNNHQNHHHQSHAHHHAGHRGGGHHGGGRR
jgi:ABC-type nickel/cobalt efflux system permease component RcnA